MPKRMSGWVSRALIWAATVSMVVFRRSISSPIEPVSSSRNSTSTGTGAATGGASTVNEKLPPGAADPTLPPAAKSYVSLRSPYRWGRKRAVPSAVVRTEATAAPWVVTATSMPAAGEPSGRLTSTMIRPLASNGRVATPRSVIRAR